MTDPAAVAVAARPAGPGDLDVLAELAVAARRPLTDVRGGPMLLASDPHTGLEGAHLASGLSDPSRLVLAGTLDDVIVGYLLAAGSTTPGGTGLAEIEELYVEPGARQVGVGAALLEQTVGWAVDRGCAGIDAVALPGDRATKNFFESHGLVARAIIAHRSLDDGSGASP